MPLSSEELSAKTPYELLDLIIEECSEVIQAATKVKRFGPLRSWPGYNGERCNADAVIREALQVNDTIRAYCAKLGVNYGHTLDRWAMRDDRDYVINEIDRSEPSPEQKNNCVICGASGTTHGMFYCDEHDGGPWCPEHFEAATGCTEETHGEGCETAVYQS